MKKQITIVILCILLFGLTPEGFGQRKNPRINSGKNLRTTILTMLQTAKEKKVPSMTCDPSGLLKSIPKKKMVASKEELAKEIGKIMDSLTRPKEFQFNVSVFDAMLYFDEVKKMTDYVFKVAKKDYGQVRPSKRKIIQAYYFRLKRAKKEGFNLKKISFKHKKCVATIVTNLKPLKWQRGYKKNDFVMSLDWQITTEVTLDCSCTKNSNKEVKKAVYTYESKTKGPMRFNDLDVNLKKIVRYGLRFEKIQAPTLVLSELNCCLEKTNPQDGSFVSPDEDINHENTFIDTNVGVSFAKDEETEMIGAAGVLFNVATLGNNPLYIGPKATVNTTTLNGNEIKATKVLVGPTAEYQIPVGEGQTRILTGLNTGYSFGNIDAFGFKQTTSGFAVNAYGGVEIGLGPNIALGVLLNFFEYNNTTFKAEEGDLETTVSNSTFITDRAAITVGLRIDLNKK
ncbi:MAG: hypothetical protein AAF489_06930 [Bacteroidota bacterium]